METLFKNEHDQWPLFLSFYNKLHNETLQWPTVPLKVLKPYSTNGRLLSLGFGTHLTRQIFNGHYLIKNILNRHSTQPFKMWVKNIPNVRSPWWEHAHWPLTLNKEYAEEYTDSQSSYTFMTFHKQCIQCPTTLPEWLRHIWQGIYSIVDHSAQASTTLLANSRQVPLSFWATCNHWATNSPWAFKTC